MTVPTPLNQLDPELARHIDDALIATVVRVVEQALTEREPGLVADLSENLVVRGGAALVTAPEAQLGDEWVGIESLSRLRSVVGGRFQNIKKKWMDAGFPLREHRGDKWQEYSLNKDGWLELSSWIAKQGFETRLTPQSREFLFELRPAGGRRAQ